MKQLLILFFLFLSLDTFGQLRPSRGAIAIGKIQAGILYDQHETVDYLGPNILNMGWTTLRGDGISELDFEFVFYQKSFSQTNLTGADIDWKRTRFSAEMQYFLSLLTRGMGDAQFHLGPTASAFFHYNRWVSESDIDYPRGESCYCAGLGIKGVYLYEVSPNFYLNFSTKLGLVDLGIMEDRILNPILPPDVQVQRNFDLEFLRRQFQIMLGFNFSLG